MGQKKLLLLLFYFGLNFGSLAQDITSDFKKIDTAYLTPHPEKFNLRLYVSRKYTDIVFNGPDRSYKFEPNSGLNLGVGFTYQTFTLNLAAPLGFMNPNRIDDWPSFLDLQSHIYPKNWIIDLFGQFYRGYRLDEGFLLNSENEYLREDMRMMLLGVNANYVFNGDRIALSAAYNQSSIQKKSAISPFIGFEAYGGFMKGDSLFLPSNENLPINYRQVDYFQLGPNAGFSSTLVFLGGFYLTAVASANLSFGYSAWMDDDKFSRWGFVPTYFLRGFLGYNGEKFSINGNYVWKNLNLVKNQGFDQELNTGNYRINLIYKLSPSENFRRKFNKINPVIWVSSLFGKNEESK